MRAQPGPSLQEKSNSIDAQHQGKILRAKSERRQASAAEKTATAFQDPAVMQVADVWVAMDWWVDYYQCGVRRVEAEPGVIFQQGLAADPARETGA